MTVAEMIDYLKTMPQDAICVAPGTDHSFRKIRYPGVETAVVEGRYYSEYSGCDADYDPPVEKSSVIVFGG